MRILEDLHPFPQRPCRIFPRSSKPLRGPCEDPGDCNIDHNQLSTLHQSISMQKQKKKKNLPAQKKLFTL